VPRGRSWPEMHFSGLRLAGEAPAAGGLELAGEPPPNPGRKSAARSGPGGRGVPPLEARLRRQPHGFDVDYVQTFDVNVE
jgi:hypothetical protein